MTHTRCSLPWQSLSVDNQGRSRICCNSDAHYRGNVHFKLADCSTVSEAMNTPYHKSVRQSMLQGERHESCKKCWDMEDSGGRSFRQIWNEILPQTDEITPQYLDITLGNKCNLTCRMCNEVNSHLWHIDNAKLGWVTDPELGNTFWFEDEVTKGVLMNAAHSASHINFLGGEPLIVGEQVALLERCIELGRADQIQLSYNSNMTVLRPRQMELWQHFKGVNLCVSIDGVGTQNDYIRQNSRWSDILHNLELIHLNCANVRMTVHATFGVYNALSLHELVAWSDAQPWFGGRLPWLNMVYRPHNQDPRCLPQEVKQLIAARIQACIKYRNFDQSYDSYIGAINHMMQPSISPTHWQEFWQAVDQLDAFKKTNIAECLPELARFRP
jgi:hypothetical protein